jgi:hypothetical protein
MSAIVTLPTVRTLGTAVVMGVGAVLKEAWNLVQALDHTHVRTEMLEMADQLQNRDPANARRLRRAAHESWMN